LGACGGVTVVSKSDEKKEEEEEEEEEDDELGVLRFPFPLTNANVVVFAASRSFIVAAGRRMTLNNSSWVTSL
tara:strand:- start:132 stop:350 length:219 start_codon:yes stop_codon:yes gene_type:complete